MENKKDCSGTWAFPIRFDRAGAPVMASGSASVEQSISLILRTAPGERLMRPTFGGGLQNYLFAPNSAVTWRAIARAVEEALRVWEPRIHVEHVDVKRAESGDGVLIAVEYRLAAEGDLNLFQGNFAWGGA